MHKIYITLEQYYIGIYNDALLYIGCTPNTDFFSLLPHNVTITLPFHFKRILHNDKRKSKHAYYRPRNIF